jgi:hypothetical protein
MLLTLILLPPGRMLAVVVAFYFYAVPAMLIGPPHFAGEFMLPQAPFGYLATLLFWPCCAMVLAVISTFVSSRGAEVPVRAEEQ